MDYNQITSFLSKFKKIIFQDETYRQVIAETITKHLTIEIEASMVSIKGTNIYIKGSPMLHSEILIHKQGILKDLSDLLPEHRFTDIK